MNPPFRPLQQPPGSNSCLPTCVRAVLSWHGQEVSPDQVSEWCREEADGCEFFLALQSLQAEGFDVVEVQDEGVLLEMFTGEDPDPVIVMVRTPSMTPNTDHAVVIHAVIHAIEPQGAALLIDYMDPLDGSNHRDATGLLLRWWDFNGSRGFIIRP